MLLKQIQHGNLTTQFQEIMELSGCLSRVCFWATVSVTAFVVTCVITDHMVLGLDFLVLLHFTAIFASIFIAILAVGLVAILIPILIWFFLVRCCKYF